MSSIFERFNYYFLVVMVGFTADILIFLLLSALGLPILPANAVAFLIGFSINIALIRMIAFPGTSVPGHLDYIVSFTANFLVMFLGTLIIWTLKAQFGLSLLVAKVMANGCTLLTNFAIRNILERYWVCFQVSRRKR